MARVNRTGLLFRTSSRVRNSQRVQHLCDLCNRRDAGRAAATGTSTATATTRATTRATSGAATGTSTAAATAYTDGRHFHSERCIPAG
jgi:hypothetical protein